MDNFNFYPFPFTPPLPPTRNLELIRTEAHVPGPCCTCKKSPGNLTCRRCKAIKYCSHECQVNDWKEHKDFCNKVKKDRVKVNAAIVALSKEFGGIASLLGSPLAKEGGFAFTHPYIVARWGLSAAYANCGKAASSFTAFRLAAENMLDILCLTYPSHSDPFDPMEMYMRYQYCGWMVAGEMDQEALNYLCYFQHRLASPHPLPYLGSSDHIEEDSYLKMLKGKKAMEWFHDYMMIALIKYKRLQSLLDRRNKDMASWKMFVMGTHSRVGEDSTIQKIRGNTLVVEKLKGFVVEETISFRMDRLNGQIKEILSAVNKNSPLIIPGLIDQSSIPISIPESSPVHAREVREARRALDSYGYAWKMSTDYCQALQLFLDTGEVIFGHAVANANESFPVKGFLQAAFNGEHNRASLRP